MLKTKSLPDELFSLPVLFEEVKDALTVPSG